MNSHGMCPVSGRLAALSPLTSLRNVCSSTRPRCLLACTARAGPDNMTAPEPRTSNMLVGPAFISRRRAVLGAACLPCCCACGASACSGKRCGWYDRYFAYAMRHFGPQYEAMAEEEKQDLFSGFLPQQEAPVNLLEVGAGTLPNSVYYQGCNVTAVDPNPAMEPYARESVAQHDLKSFTMVQGVAEQLPFDTGSFDRVVCTLVLCSVNDVPAAVAEIKRVLRKGGKWLFLEHVAAGRDRPIVRTAQNVLTPLQSALADGCHLNRDPLETIRQTGFSFEKEKRFDMPGLSILGPHISGIAIA